MQRLNGNNREYEQEDPFIIRKSLNFCFLLEFPLKDGAYAVIKGFGNNLGGPKWKKIKDNTFFGFFCKRRILLSPM